MKKIIVTTACLLATSVQAEVTYEQILKDPDNIALNRSYARERLAAGDLSQALVSLERIILLQPLNMDARLARAQVLMRLGNFALAKQELTALDALPLADSQANEVDELLAQIATQMERWTTTGSVSLGLAHDDNVGAIDDALTVTDSEGLATQRSDYSAFAQASITMSYDVGNQTQDRVFFGFRAGNAVGDDSNLKENKTAGATIGATINRNAYKSRVTLNWDGTYRDDLTAQDGQTVEQDDVSTLTLTGQVSRQMGSHTLSLTGSYSEADFSGRATDLSDRSDASTKFVSVGTFSLLADDLAISMNFGGEQRRATKREVPNAIGSQDRDVVFWSGSIIWQAAAGHRWTFGAQAKELNYKKIVGTDGEVRDDTQNIYSLGYTLLGAVIDPSLKDWSFNLSGNRNQVDSNLTRNNVTNNRFQMTATYRF